MLDNHCCYYGTLHLEATKVLADIINVHGQRVQLLSHASNFRFDLGQRAL
jgi:hypothetical protein